MSQITWYGHSAFRIEANGASVLIDPFFAPNSGVNWQQIPKCDIVLITHDHADHVGDAVEICKATGAMLGCMVGTADRMMAKGVPSRQILNGIGFNIGGTVCCQGIACTMTQAFHSSATGMPAGYIITMPDGQKIYHAGDTGIFSSMALLGEIYHIDVGLLPIGGVFTMDGLQAANAARLLGCPRVIPMHWGTFPALAQSPAEFMQDLARICPTCQALEMKIGETINLAA